MRRYLVPIVIIVLAAAFGVALYYALENRANQPTDADNQQNFYEVREMGIKFEIPDDLNDLTHSIRQANDAEGQPVIAYFSADEIIERARALNDQDGQTYCASQYGPLGAIVKLQEFPRTANRPLPPNTKILDNYYVFYEGPQAACTNNQQVQQLVSQKTQQLQSAFNTVQTLDGKTGEPLKQSIIEGSLSYPSEGIPPGMSVCAENQDSKIIYCTQDQIQDQKYQYGYGYMLYVPAGRYQVYATLAQNPRDPTQYRAYYNEFVKCGISVECTDHTPITVEAQAGQTVSDINPQDWYQQR